MIKPPISNFVTARLEVSHWGSHPAETPSPVEELRRILSPPVLEFLPPSLAVEPTPDGLTNWIAARLDESDVYLVRKLQAELIGLLLIVSDTDDNGSTFHLGYLFAECAWGNGYATELINGIVLAARDAAPVKLVGGVALGNTASAHLLVKCGFTLVEDKSDHETEYYERRV